MVYVSKGKPNSDTHSACQMDGSAGMGPCYDTWSAKTGVVVVLTSCPLSMQKDALGDTLEGPSHTVFPQQHIENDIGGSIFEPQSETSCSRPKEVESTNFSGRSSCDDKGPGGRGYKIPQYWPS